MRADFSGFFLQRSNGSVELWIFTGALLLDSCVGITGRGFHSHLCNDSITFILARWFEPHSDADDRDENHRPVCPSPLHINHCLWKYARARKERCMLRTQYTSTQVGLFGKSQEEQRRTINNEKRAYFCLVSPENVLCRANMCPQFVKNSSKFDTSTWMQTVVLI